MRLYVEPMDAVLVEVDTSGRVRFEDDEQFKAPSLQERRAILYSATRAVEELEELIDRLQD